MKKIGMLSLLYLLVHTTNPQADTIRLSAVGVRLGPAHPSIYYENAFSIGLNADIVNVAPGRRLCPYVDFWRAGFVKKSTEHWNWRLFAVGLSALLPIHLNNSKAKPYIGGGAGLNFNTWTIDDMSRQTPSSNTFDMDLSLHAVAGLELPLAARLNGYLEFKYALAGVANYFGFWFGVKFKVNGA